MNATLYIDKVTDPVVVDLLLEAVPKHMQGQRLCCRRKVLSVPTCRIPLPELIYETANSMCSEMEQYAGVSIHEFDCVDLALCKCREQAVVPGHQACHVCLERGNDD